MPIEGRPGAWEKRPRASLDFPLEAATSLHREPRIWQIAHSIQGAGCSPAGKDLWGLQCPQCMGAPPQKGSIQPY